MRDGVEKEGLNHVIWMDSAGTLCITSSSNFYNRGVTSFEALYAGW
jgi:hypothetical protein